MRTRQALFAGLCTALLFAAAASGGPEQAGGPVAVRAATASVELDCRDDVWFSPGVVNMTKVCEGDPAAYYTVFNWVIAHEDNGAWCDYTSNEPSTPCEHIDGVWVCGEAPPPAYPTANGFCQKDL
jgi:hypothetical protein